MKTFLTGLLCFCSLLLKQNCSFAQASYAHFTHLTSKDGLPGNTVYTIFQDKTGYLWFGSYNCLTRYDGYNYLNFQHDPTDPHSIPKGTIRSIAEDTSGYLWIAAETGVLAKFNPVMETCTRINLGDSDKSTNPVCELIPDNKNCLWIMTRNGWLRKLDIGTGKIRSYTERDFTGAYEKYCSALCKDNNGNIWIGLNKYNPSKDRFESEVFDPAEINFFNHNGILSIAFDKFNNIWAGTSKGLVKFNTVTLKIAHYLNKGTHNIFITHLIYDAKQDCSWFYASNIGLYRMDLTGKTDFYLQDILDPNGLSQGIAHSLLRDQSGNLWVATETSLNKLSPLSQKFKSYKIDPTGKNGINDPVLRSLYMDDQGTIWVGTRGRGLNKMTLNPSLKYKQYYLEPLISNFYGNNFVNCICRFKKDRLLIGSATGIYIFNTKTGKPEKHILLAWNKNPFHVDIGYSVWSILSDTGNNIWIGTQNKGLFLYSLKTGKKKHFASDSLEKENPFWNLFRDSHSEIWSCTHDGIVRICKKENGGFYLKKYTCNPNDPTGYQGEDAWDIYEDRDGIFWIATLGGGLNRFDPVTEKFKNFTIKDGLPTNELCGILEDNHDHLWISTLKGIFVFDKKSRKVINTYSESDGLQGDYFGFKVCLKNKDGEMFFGGQNGLNSFDPKQINIALPDPVVAVTSFMQYYKKRSLDKRTITLKYNENSISFDFSVLDFTNPLKNQYRCYLEGIDQTWSPPGYAHFASYNYLPPGRYIFHLMGSNSSHMWSKPVEYAIYIQPPFWKTLWFNISVSVSALLLISWFVYAQIRQQNEKRKRLESDLTALRAQLNPHFIFNSLSSLQHFITEQKDKLALDYLSKFGTLIRMILTNSRKTLISIADELKFLELYTFMESIRFQNRITFDISVDEELNKDELKIPPMLIQPLIENSIKHGLTGVEKNGIIKIHFKADKNFIYCTVADNGIGLIRAEENKSRRFIDFPSLSTSLIKERIGNLQSKNGKKGNLELFNIEKDNIICGAISELKIPKRIKLT